MPLFRWSRVTKKNHSCWTPRRMQNLKTSFGPSKSSSRSTCWSASSHWARLPMAIKTQTSWILSRSKKSCLAIKSLEPTLKKKLRALMETSITRNVSILRWNNWWSALISQTAVRRERLHFLAVFGTCTAQWPRARAAFKILHHQKMVMALISKKRRRSHNRPIQLCTKPRRMISSGTILVWPMYPTRVRGKRKIESTTLRSRSTSRLKHSKTID